MLNIYGQHERTVLKAQILAALMQDTQICMVLSSRTCKLCIGHDVTTYSYYLLVCTFVA